MLGELYSRCDHAFLEWIWAFSHTFGILRHTQGLYNTAFMRVYFGKALNLGDYTSSAVDFVVTLPLDILGLYGLGTMQEYPYWCIDRNNKIVIVLKDNYFVFDMCVEYSADLLIIRLTTLKANLWTVESGHFWICTIKVARF